jgi:hypothetical protein
MAKASSPVRPGFQTVTPHLTVRGAAEYIDFLKRAFGAVELSRVPGPGGKLMHAEVRIGDAIVMLNDDFPEFGLPPVAEGRLRVTLHVYVPDVDSLWDRASSALRTPLFTCCPPRLLATAPWAATIKGLFRSATRPSEAESLPLCHPAWSPPESLAL